MKRSALLFLFMLILVNCDSADPDPPITKNATILIDESEVDNCLYTIKTESNEFFTTDKLPVEFSENSFDAQITFQLTEEKSDCGFSGSLIKIKVLKLVEL